MAGVATGVVLAQSAKVSIRMAPTPDQTIRMTMVQDMDVELSFDANAPSAPAKGPMKLTNKATMTLTQKIGARKADGTVDAELTYDEIRTEMSINGQPLPATGAETQLVGKAIVVTYSQSGEIVDVKGPPVAGLTTEALKQMMNSFYGNLPVAAIGVGEIASAPLDFALPLPLPGAAPMKMGGQARVKLVAIDTDAKGRSARFESTIDGKMLSNVELPLGSQKATMTFDFTMGGTGTSLMDLDKGLLRSSQSTSTFTGTIKTTGDAAPAAMPGMNMRGTIKVTITGS